MATEYNNVTICAKLYTIARAISRLTKYLVSLQAMCIDAKTITYFVRSYFISKSIDDDIVTHQIFTLVIALKTKTENVYI